MIRSGLLSRPRRADSPAAFARVFGVRLRGSISPTAVSAIASAIQTQEGYYPGSLAYQNNNPGNLVYAGQPGATPGAGGFAYFATPALGAQAMQNQINLDATRGTDVNGNPTTTLAELLTSWAPPSQNDTATYIANVSASTGYDPNAPLSSLGDPSGDSGSAIDLSALSTDVDLSGIGIASPIPVYALIGLGLVAVALLK